MASQAKISASNSTSKSWILVSTLPKAYKTNPTICIPTIAGGGEEAEASYTSLYTFVVSVIMLNNGTLAEAKLERYLKRVNAETYTTVGSTDKILTRMAKEGYVEKRRDTSSGEEVVEWVVGPRGKVEVGTGGVEGLVKKVYGVGNNVEEHEQDEDLEMKIKRSLGIKDDGARIVVDGGGAAADEEDAAGEAEVEAEESRRRPKKGAREEESDDDDE